jgi:hypothetical protein
MRKSVLQILALFLATVPLSSSTDNATEEQHQHVQRGNSSDVPASNSTRLEELRRLADSVEMQKARVAKQKYMDMFYPRTQEETRNNGHFRPHASVPTS